MRDTRAYTVIEMLTVLFIIVIVGALIAPGLAQLAKRSKVSSSVAAVSGVLRTARSLAITKNDVHHARMQMRSVDGVEEFWASAVWLKPEVEERYSSAGPDWATIDDQLIPTNPATVKYETIASARLERGTRLAIGTVSLTSPGGPRAEFTWSPTVPDPGQDVDFVDASSDTDGGTITSHYWNFAGQATSTEEDPSLAFSSAGIYLVTLTVVDDDGKQGSASYQLTVSDESNLTFSPALFFWPDGSASQELVFTVQVADPEKHDDPKSIRVRASGVVEELP